MTQQQALTFHSLSFVSEGEDVVVGRPDTGSYAVLPADGAALLRRLSDGEPPQTAAAWYEETYGEPVDLDDFLETMEELGFLRAPDQAVTRAAVPRFQWLGRAVFSPPALIGYLALMLVWAVLALPHSDIRPSSSQIFFVRSVIVVQLVVFFGQLPFIALHESFHVLAGQRAGLASKLSISNRLSYVVFETRTNGMLSLPRQKRYLPFLAGMLFDLIAIATLDLAAQFTRHPAGALSGFGKLCLACSFAVFTRIAWQFLLYLRTDLYYVLATAMNCHDLHDASKALMKNRLWRVLRRPDRLLDESQWTERDLKVAAWYGWFLVLGAVTMAGIILFITIPVAVTYLSRVASGLLAGRHDGLFWDSLCSLSLIMVQFVLPAYLARRKRRRNTARPLRLANPGAL
jgi:hypothetical protein